MPISVVSFYDVKEHWNASTQQWDDEKFQYIGRANPKFNLPGSIYGNPFRIVNGVRGTALDPYRNHLRNRPALVEQAKWELKDKTLVCYCRRKPRLPGEPVCCHGDILKELVEGDDDGR